LTQVNSDLVKTNLTFTVGVDTELVANTSYKQDGIMYIDLSIKTLIDNAINTQRYLGKLSQAPNRTRTILARTVTNYVLAGWIGTDGGIYLYNRSGVAITAGQTFEVMCIVPLM